MISPENISISDRWTWSWDSTLEFLLKLNYAYFFYMPNPKSFPKSKWIDKAATDKPTLKYSCVMKWTYMWSCCIRLIIFSYITFKILFICSNFIASFFSFYSSFNYYYFVQISLKNCLSTIRLKHLRLSLLLMQIHIKLWISNKIASSKV